MDERLGFPVAPSIRLKEVVHEKESGTLFFVFEFMGGGNLFTEVRSHPEGVPEDRIRSVM